jgi:tetratricopeptide (TPR) repeat protein
MIRVISLLLFLNLTACATLDLTRETPQSILKKTNLLVKQKRWAEAEELLSQGAQEFPDETQIRDKLAEVQSEWQTNVQRLEDWMLLYETEAMLLQRPLLVSMSESDPDDIILKARLQLHNASLRSKRALLIACAENHQGKEIKLARRCIEAARIINETYKVQQLLAGIKEKQQGIQREQLARNKAEQRQTAIAQSRKHLENNEYVEVVQLLQSVIAEHPDDVELNVLYQEAKAGRDLQILQLISQGDRLYRSERTEEALDVWKQAEQLDPTFEDLNTRIVRAEKVLKQLQKIKESN